jgi:hypothetical protein
MSFVPVTPEMSYLLDALWSWPVSDEVLDQLKAMPEWEQAQAWGWVIRTGQLTGMGARHAPGELPRGIII